MTGSMESAIRVMSGQACLINGTPSDVSPTGNTDVERQSAYRVLYRGRIPERDLTVTREATNKAWALDDDWFKAQIKARAEWRSVPLGRGVTGGRLHFGKPKINKSMTLMGWARSLNTAPYSQDKKR